MREENSGLFVTFDGANGAGKSTTILKVSEKLKEMGLKVVCTKEPMDSVLGSVIRKNEESIKGNALACLIAADRYSHIENVVLPALQENRVVLSDRYFPSSLILQSLDGVKEEFIWGVNAEIIKPHLCFILMAKPNTLDKRVKERPAITRLEREFTREAEVNMVNKVISTLLNDNFNVVTIENEDELFEKNVELICQKIIERANFLCL